MTSGDQRDPIQMLADQMHNDHQLDDNALGAIDLDVTAHVDTATALLRPTRGRIRAGGEGEAQEIGRRISVRPFGRFAMPIHAL